MHRKSGLACIVFAVLCIGRIEAQHEPHEPPDTDARERRQEEREQTKHRQEAEATAARAREAEALRVELAADNSLRAAGGKVIVTLSAESWSGEGKDYGDWYSLTNVAPVGYAVRDVLFRLVGDRQCNAWAECQETEHTPTRVTWRFRMQGHDEAKSLEVRSFFVEFAKSDDTAFKPGMPKVDVRMVGRKATSVGVLKVRYLPNH